MWQNNWSKDMNGTTFRVVYAFNARFACVNEWSVSQTAEQARMNDHVMSWLARWLGGWSHVDNDVLSSAQMNYIPGA